MKRTNNNNNEQNTSFLFLALGVKNANRSPFFSKKKMGGKASSEFNFLPLVVPGWLEQLPIPPGRRSRRTSEEQGPINMKSILRYKYLFKHLKNVKHFF